MAVTKSGQSQKGGESANRRDKERGIYLDPGPYIAIVINNVDNKRMGFVTVHIPDLAADVEEVFDVRFASPFMSYTRQEGSNGDFESVKQAAGMWFPAPDVGTEVVVMFPSGDTNKGIWFACIQDRYNNHTMPGHASTEFWDTASDPKRDFENPDSKQYNKLQATGEMFDPILKDTVNYYNDVINPVVRKKPINTYLSTVYKNQGLIEDNIRGHTTSSAQRETPSNVFGISTKGRPTSDIKNNPTLANKLRKGDIKEINSEELNTFKFATRKQGHTFVLDDGDLEGKNELIRLRSSSGHQVLLHDSEGVVYIGNSTGTVWLEFGNDGTVDLYSQNSLNVRSANMNFYADKDINIHAKNNVSILAGNKFQADGGNIKMKSTITGIGIESISVVDIKGGGAVNIEASGNANLKASRDVKIDGSCVELGNGADGVSAPVTALVKNPKKDTVKIDNGFWGPRDDKKNKIETISNRVPTHEPFVSRNANRKGDDEVTLADRQRQEKETSKKFKDDPKLVQPGVEQARNHPLEREDKLTRGSFIKQPEPSDTVGDLTADQTKALLASIGQRESRGDYQAVNQDGLIGKYQLGAEALEDAGYIKKGTFAQASKLGGNPNNVLDDPNVWIRGGGKQEFLQDKAEQERAMEIYTQQNHNTLKRIGVINNTTTQEEQAGFIAAAHLVGPDAAKQWANTGVREVDGNDVTADNYYNIGRSAALSAGEEGDIQLASSRSVPTSTPTSDGPSSSTTVAANGTVTRKENTGKVTFIANAPWKPGTNLTSSQMGAVSMSIGFGNEVDPVLLAQFKSQKNP